MARFRDARRNVNISVMPMPPLVPKGEALRHAVAWLAERGVWTPDLVNEACQRFDIAPADEEFLLGECRRMHEERLRAAAKPAQ